MLGLSGLGQAALGALPPNGTVPLSSLRSGTIYLVRQEIPDHPRPRFWAGVQGPNVAAQPQVKSSVLTVQEPPWHPRPSFNAGIQGPNVRVPVTDSVFVKQQWPDHPLPRTWAGQQQLGNVGLTPQIIDRVFTVQEMPWHPRPYLWVAPPPVPKVPLYFGLNTTQEMPWHPRPFLFSGKFPTDFEDIQLIVIL